MSVARLSSRHLFREMGKPGLGRQPSKSRTRVQIPATAPYFESAIRTLIQVYAPEHMFSDEITPNLLALQALS